MCFVVNTQLRVDVRCEFGFEGENGLFTICSSWNFPNSHRPKPSRERKALGLPRKCSLITTVRGDAETKFFGFPALTTVSSMRKNMLRAFTILLLRDDFTWMARFLWKFRFVSASIREPRTRGWFIQKKSSWRRRFPFTNEFPTQP